MKHLTFNTGDVRESPRSEVGNDVVRLLQPLCANGCHDIPNSGGCTVTVTRVPGGAMFTVHAPAPVRGMPRLPLVTCACAWAPVSVAELWDCTENLYHRITEQGGGVMLAEGALAASPEQPEALPWLAVVLHLGLGFARNHADWLGDFERCLAWALIEGDQ